MTPPHVERDADLVRLLLAIGSGRGDGVRIALLRGLPGVGRSTLLDDVARPAADRGFAVCRDVASASALLDAASRPVLLLLDDADRRDGRELDALLQLLACTGDRDIALVLVEAGAGTGDWARARAALETAGIVQHVRLEPMRQSLSRELVRSASADRDDADVDQVVARAGGFPGYLLELASAPTGSVPASIQQATARRVAELAPATIDVLQVLALGEQPLPPSSVANLERLHAAPEATAELVAAGFLRATGDGCQVWPPVIREAIVARQAAPLRRVAHAELADALLAAAGRSVALDVALAEHRAAAGAIDESVALLALLAYRREAAGQIDEAVTLLQRAMSRAGSAQERMLLARRAAETAHQARRGDLALDLWQSLYVASERDGDDERRAYALVQWAWAGDQLADRSRLERASRLAPDGGWSAYASAVLSSLDGALDDAVKHARRALSAARRHGDEQLRSIVGEKLAYWLLDSGHESNDALELLDASRTANRELGLHYSTVSAWSNLTQLLLEALRTSEALEESSALVAHAAAQPRPRLEALAHCMHARCLAAAGELEAAAAAAARALELAGEQLDETRLLAVAIAADVQLATGDVPRARRAIRDLREATEGGGHDFFAFEVGFAQARLDVLEGSTSRASGWASGATTGSLPALADAALWAARAGVELEDPGLRSAAGELRARAARASSALARISLEEVHAAIAAVPDPDESIRLGEQWEAAGRPVDGAHCRVAAAVALSAHDPAAARAQLDVALIALRRAGARADADAAAARMRSLGRLAPAERSASGVGTLSARELQVARLVAAGLSNAQVADRTGLSESTVRTHLRSVFRKLRVRSRSELAADWHRVLEG